MIWLLFAVDNIKLMLAGYIPKDLLTESIIIEALKRKGGFKFSNIPDEMLTQRLVDKYCGGEGPIKYRSSDQIYCDYSQYVRKNFPNEELSKACDNYSRIRSRQGP